MFKKLFRALFLRKKKAVPPKPECRPTERYAVPFSSARSQPSSDNPMLNPLHPLNPANPVYDSDDGCRRHSHEPVSSSHCSSSWGSSDSGSSSSSDCGSSCSNSCD